MLEFKNIFILFALLLSNAGAVEQFKNLSISFVKAPVVAPSNSLRTVDDILKSKLVDIIRLRVFYRDDNGEVMRFIEFTKDEIKSLVRAYDLNQSITILRGRNSFTAEMQKKNYSCVFRGPQGQELYRFVMDRRHINQLKNMSVK